MENDVAYNAYSVKGLVAELKKEGLELSEEAAKVVTKGMFRWLTKSAISSSTQLDNLLVPFYPLVEAKIVELEDKINPEG